MATLPALLPPLWRESMGVTVDELDLLPSELDASQKTIFLS